MLTYYCPHCWSIIQEGQTTCPSCGYILDEFEKSDFEEKLLVALYHPVTERKIMAAQILGLRHSQRALSEFLKIVVSEEMDYFFLRSILLATAKINHPERENILRKATQHPSELIAHLANELLEELAQGHSLNQWDRHTG